MHSKFRLTHLLLLVVISLLLGSCAAADSSPEVVFGYLPFGNYNELPAAFVDYEPGMTVVGTDSPDPTDLTARFSTYKVAITSPSGKTTEVEFFITQVNPSVYEAEVDGVVTKVLTYAEFREDGEAAVQDKLAFAIMPGGFGKPLMQFPVLCPEAAEVHEQYSTIPDRDWLNSLDSITLACPATGKTYTFKFTYERDLSIPESYIKRFEVKINETAAN